MLYQPRTEKITFIDLDFTIIRPKSEQSVQSGDTVQPIRTWYEDESDWEFISPNVPEKLKKVEQDSDIVILTNQRGISKARFRFELR